MDYKKMQIEDIINWCVANNETAWLKEAASRQVDYKVYPRVKDENGKWHTDKNQDPRIEKRPISFVQLKIEFVNKFMPEIAPKKKEKEPNMYQRIALL